MVRPTKLDDLHDWLWETLEDWQDRSLKWRCSEIGRAQGINVGPRTLGAWYKKQAIRHKLTRYKVANRYPDEDMKRLQRRFVVMLAGHL